MIEIQGGIEIGPGIYMGEFPEPSLAVYFVTQADEYLISESGDYFIDQE